MHRHPWMDYTANKMAELHGASADLMGECRKIGLAAKLNAREAEALAMAAVENASDVAAHEQLAVARSAMQSYVNGDTRGADLDYLLGYCRPRSRAAAKLIKQ